MAVCDIDRSKAEAFARDFGVAEVFIDAEAMLKAIRPDFVDVATTAESHRPLVELALAHGVLTVCQKPFAETPGTTGWRWSRRRSAAGRPLIVHENFRWERAFRIVRPEIDAGAIGSPHFARLSFRHGYDVYANQPYLARVEDFALMDVGLHLFDVARFLMGDVASVACMTQRLNPTVSGEDAFTALLRHKSGGVSSVECCFFSKIAPDPFPETFAWIEEPEGTIEVTYGCRASVQRDGAVREIDGDPPVPSWGAKPWHMA